MLALYIFSYTSAFVFVLMVVSKAIKIARSPVHLRWELYPVPHEKGKAHYGGSRLEELDWWEKPLKKDHLAQWLYMFREIVFLHGVRKHNPKLWWGSFPFHFALYLYIFNTFVIIIGAILLLNGYRAETSGLWTVLSRVSVITGWALSVLGIAGAAVLLYRRITDRALSSFSTASHYFNILLIGGIYVSGLTWLATDGSFFMNITGYFAGLISFFMPRDLPAAGMAHVAISAAFAIYLPFTHMTHFFAKYFTYHSVRWDVAPNSPGSPIEAKVARYLNYPVTWAAPHIGADGSKSWLSIASEMPGMEAKNVK